MDDGVKRVHNQAVLTWRFLDLTDDYNSAVERAEFVLIVVRRKYKEKSC